MKLAFVGFRHGHVMSLYAAATADQRVEVVAACEEDAATAERLGREGKVRLTHASYRAMLGEVACDAVAVGDAYGLRGARIAEALRRGKHVISDKPICTRTSELDEIERLSRGLKVGCLLDMRGSGSIRTVRRLIGEGAIGEVHTVSFTAQHPLLYGSRPMWYFEPGMHGGTINDIGIHAFDAIPWMTGREIAGVICARAWNAKVKQHPEFQDGAQFLLTLDNGGGVMGDCSYLAPDGCGYAVPEYWRFLIHGTDGVIERVGERVTIAGHEDKSPREVEVEKSDPNSPLEAFLGEIEGRGAGLGPSTAEVFEASRLALRVQAAAG